MHSTEDICHLLDTFIETSKIKQACRACGIAPAQFWLWLEQSGAGNDRFFFEWGGKLGWFHEHYSVARRRNILLFEGDLRHVVRHGYEVPVIHNGVLQYAVNPESVGLDDDQCRIMAIDRIARDELGMPIPLTIPTVPAASLVAAAAAALMPEQFGVRRDTTVTIQHAPTVLRIGATKAAQPTGQDASNGAEAAEMASTGNPAGRALERPLTRAELVARIQAIDNANGAPARMKRPPANGLPLDLGNGASRSSDPPEKVTGANIPADGAARREIRREIDRTGRGPEPAKGPNGTIGYKMA